MKEKYKGERKINEPAPVENPTGVKNETNDLFAYAVTPAESSAGVLIFFI